MKNFVQAGKSITYANSSGDTIASGSGVVVGGRLCVAAGDIADGSSGPLDTEGVFNLTKKTSDNISQGDRLYWDSGNSRLTITPGAVFAGIAWAAADTSATKAHVALSDDAPQAAVVAALTGASGGTANGALEDEGAVSSSGGNTYTDAAVNAVTAKLKNNVAELAATQAAVLVALKAAGLMASS